MSEIGAGRTPYVLVDEPEDGYCESWGWVESTVTEERARDLLAEFAVDDETGDLARPLGPAGQVYLRLINPDDDYELQRWDRCKPDEPGARKFWEIDCRVVEKQGADR